MLVVFLSKMLKRYKNPLDVIIHKELPVSQRTSAIWIQGDYNYHNTEGKKDIFLCLHPNHSIFGYRAGYKIHSNAASKLGQT